MAKYCGKVGYIKPVESEPGVWEEQVIERTYYGDIVRLSSRYQQTDNVNDNIVLNNTISIVADPFACENFQHMRYVIYMGARWTITNVEVNYPRITLSVGGVYNGQEA